MHEHGAARPTNLVPASSRGSCPSSAAPRSVTAVGCATRCTSTVLRGRRTSSPRPLAAPAPAAPPHARQRPSAARHGRSRVLSRLSPQLRHPTLDNGRQLRGTVHEHGAAQPMNLVPRPLAALTPAAPPHAQRRPSAMGHGRSRVLPRLSPQLRLSTPNDGRRLRGTVVRAFSASRGSRPSCTAPRSTTAVGWRGTVHEHNAAQLTNPVRTFSCDSCPNRVFSQPLTHLRCSTLMC